MASTCFAITGGSGYIGLRLARRLKTLDQSAQVLLLDIQPPLIDESEHSCDTDRLVYRHCDLRSLASVRQALADVTCVFHLASYGMSGREMLNAKMIYEVNVCGTENVLRACVEYGIKKLIYCSTYNAIYTGDRELVGVTEDQCSYPSEKCFFDNYSRTKSLAEQLVLKASSSKLHTVAIRPAAIYGDGEARHLPRILNLVQQGLAFFAVGHEGILCDWLYADNLIEALILAEKSLPTHSGEAYFISDDHPVNNFQFLAQLTEGLGYKNCFTFYIPTSLMFYLGHMIELVHNVFARHVYNFAPFLTRAEVLKVGVTHYADISKAKRLLGYQVKVTPDEGMRRCVRWFDQHGYRKQKSKDTYGYIWLLIGCLLLLFIIFVSSIVR